jgi:two-component system KDP operon response regulator KdpE
VARVLVVDDDPALLRVLSMGLGVRGHTVLTATNGRQALTKAATSTVDLVVLDLGLPDMDGLEVTRLLRAQSDVPIIVLSAEAAEGRKVAALDGGADDYMTKPFGLAELEARIRLAARHWNQRNADEPVSKFAVGPLEIDLERHRATMRGTPVDLTPREFELLAYLARYPGKVLTHRTILAEVWGPGYVDEVHYLRVYVHRLRRILGDEEGQFLRTEPGVGYALPGDPAT